MAGGGISRRLHPRNEVNKLIHAQLPIAVGVEFLEDSRQVVCGNAPSLPEIVRQKRFKKKKQLDQ